MIDKRDSAAAELDQLRKEFKPNRCEVNGVQYESAPQTDPDRPCADCAGYGDVSLCGNLGPCWPVLGGHNAPVIWIKVPE